MNIKKKYGIDGGITGTVPSVQEYVDEFIYNPYSEKLVVSLGKDTIELKGVDWTVILNTEEGSFRFNGSIDKYYDIVRVYDIWLKFGDLFSIKNMNDSLHK